MLGHLQFLLESERGEDLSLRRFSPLEYSFKLSGPVECPFEGCDFQADLGKTMINHQQEVRHPAWNRHNTTREGQSTPWHCGLRTCQKAFPTWDGCYKHMQSHNKPLACPVCESYGTDRMPRLRKHLKDVHGQKTQEAATSRGRVEVNSSQNKGKYSHPLSLEATNSSTQNFRQHVPSS